MTEPYDPLSYDNLARSVVDALLNTDSKPLPPDRFEGAGVYAIYYTDSLDYVEDYSFRETPIYVGKAIHSGARRGRGNIDKRSTTALYARLRQHARSIDDATNLSLPKAKCRYLVVVDVWIALAEQSLISHFNPIWNTALAGFGNHDVGRNRQSGARPRWDIVHPGREWASRLPAQEERGAIVSDITERWVDHNE